MARNPQISSGVVSRELALDAYLPYKGYKTTAAASATLAAKIGEALPDKAIAVTLVNYEISEPVYIQFTGDAADNTAFQIPAGAGMTIPGDKVALDNIRIYAANTAAIGVITYVLQK
jgi:hypothetical protein